MPIMARNGLDGGNKVAQNIADPTAAQHAATKNYVDTYSAYARYERQSGTQTFVNGDQLVQYPTAVTTSPLVTKSTNSYTLAAGTWAISASFRVDMTGQSNTDFAIYIVTGTSAIETTAVDGAWGKDPLANLSTIINLSSPTAISIVAWRGAAGGTIISYGTGFTHVAFARQ